MKANVVVTIDQNGKFIGAESLELPQAIIPVDEDSASRSGTKAEPLPLNDKLSYLDADFGEFFKDEIDPNTKKPYIKQQPELHNKYMEKLKRWASDANYSHPKVKAIYQYLVNNRIGKDVLGAISKTAKEWKDSQFVCFRVMDTDAGPHAVSETWKDISLFNSWINYYESVSNTTGYDYVTGEYGPLAEKIPAKIRNTGDKAKIYSTNDSSKYEGRFLNVESAVTVGRKSMEKAISALRFLVECQKNRVNSENIVCWSNENVNEALPITEDSFEDLLDGFFEKSEDETMIMSSYYADQIKKLVHGYKSNDDLHQHSINVMAIDTADGSMQGRLSIVYYCSLNLSGFYENLLHWNKECCWKIRLPHGKSSYTFIGAPLPKDIAAAAYGKEMGNYIDVDDKVLKKTINRILPCIVQHRKIPKDIVFSAIHRVNNPLGYSVSEKGISQNWEKVLNTTCALIVKYHFDYRGGELVDMALDLQCTDRNYLFGRLIAVAESFEIRANYKSDTHRVTNAKKFWSQFVMRPAATWKTIYGKLNRYEPRLNVRDRVSYNNLIGEILNGLGECDGYNNEALNENYLLGYYAQREVLKTKNNKEQAEKEED